MAEWPGDAGACPLGERGAAKRAFLASRLPARVSVLLLALLPVLLPFAAAEVKAEGKAEAERKEKEKEKEKEKAGYSVMFSYAELATPKGRSEVYNRLKVVAEDYCPNFSRVKSMQDVAACRADVLQDLVTQINDPRLTAYVRGEVVFDFAFEGSKRGKGQGDEEAPARESR